MSNATVSDRRWLILLVTINLAACGGSNETLSHEPSAVSKDAAELRLASFAIEEREALRVRNDALRNRLWVLTLDDVRVYDSAKKTLIRRIALPAWSVVRYICMPDMTLDRTGSALITSNSHPVIWRIDADSFELKEREITLQGRESWAMGFGALAFAADGTLFALTSVANSLWAVDVTEARAKLVTLYEPPLEECALPARSVGG